MRLFRYLYWLLRKLDNWKFSDVTQWDLTGKIVWQKPQRLWGAQYLTKILVKFPQDPINLHTLLIHLNRGTSGKNLTLSFRCRKRFTVCLPHWRRSVPCHPKKTAAENMGLGIQKRSEKRFKIELTAFNWFITVCGSLTPFKKNYVFVDDSKLVFSAKMRESWSNKIHSEHPY